MSEKNSLKIITDENLMETRSHGHASFPFQYYFENIWDFDFHTLDWHWHKELEFIYIQKGEVHCYIGNKTFSLSEGYGMFINTKIVHKLTAEQSVIISNIVFSPSLIATPDSIIYQEFIEPVLTASLPFFVFNPSISWHKEILIMMNQIFEIQENAAHNELTTLRMLVSLWDILFLHIKSSLEQEHPSQSNSNIARLQIMMSFIHSHYTEPIQLSDIAAAVHISKNCCMQIFKNEIQQSPVSYLIQYRLKSAAQLLSSTETKIVAIAERCGFHDASYFCRIFKELYKVSPAEYRKKFR